MTTDIVNAAKELMRRSSAYNHPFLKQLHTETMDRQGAVRFAVQWYKAATAHKRAFPGLIYNTPDDRIRMQLIEILREEYGFGEESSIHAHILQKFVRALGLDITLIPTMATEAGVEQFSHKVDEAWVHGNPVKAFGVHFALEFLAANMHKAFFAGVQTLGLEPEDIEYFQIHSIAEDAHATLAQIGMEHLVSDKSNRKQLLEGVREGTRLVTKLLDGLVCAYQGGNRNVASRRYAAEAKPVM